VRLFRNHPRLAMLGGFRGRMDVGSRFDKSTGQLWGKKYGPHYIPVKMVDPKSRLLYMPMYKVNAAPLVVDRRVFAELGGFNANFSCVGDSGIDFDFEYSIRCVSPYVALACIGVRPSVAFRLVLRTQPQVVHNLGRQQPALLPVGISKVWRRTFEVLRWHAASSRWLCGRRVRCASDVRLRPAAVDGVLRRMGGATGCGRAGTRWR
jgi:hypothetical protein